jgi:hypothetical protein
MTPAAPDRRPEQLLADSCQHLDGAVSAASRNQQCHRPVGDQRCPQPPASISNAMQSARSAGDRRGRRCLRRARRWAPANPRDGLLLAAARRGSSVANAQVKGLRHTHCGQMVRRTLAALGCFAQRAVLTHGCAWILRRHLGVYKWESTPSFRGFDSFYGYYHGAEDYFNRKNATRPAL